MVLVGPCIFCRGNSLFPDAAPRHCYGTGDTPAPRGTLGGFWCSCACRHDQRKEHGRMSTRIPRSL